MRHWCNRTTTSTPRAIQGRDHPVRAEEPVDQDDVAGLELGHDHPEQGQFAGLLALIRPDRGLEHRAHGQAEHHQDARDREPQARLLAVRLGVCLLVRRGVGHDHGGAVDDLDRPLMKQPGFFRFVMDRFTASINQIPEDALGQMLPGLAVAGRLGGDRGESLVVSKLLESVDGVIAGLVVGEDLGEEDAQCDPRGVDPLPPRMVGVAASRLDVRLRQELEEGEPLLLCELISVGTELVAGSRGSRLSHGDLLGVVNWRTGTNRQITNQGGRFAPPRGHATRPQRATSSGHPRAFGSRACSVPQGTDSVRDDIIDYIIYRLVIYCVAT